MIYFVRHGATDWNDNLDENGKVCPKCQGRVDLPLNQHGIEQAKQTAQLLNNVNFSKVVCSPLLRARQTCDIIYKGSTPIEIDERVVERDFGEFEGLMRSEFDFAGFWDANSKQKYKKAESIAQVQKRVFALLDELKRKPNDDVLIVSHGGVGLIVLSYFFGVPADGNYLKFEMPHGKPMTLDFNDINKKK